MAVLSGNGVLEIGRPDNDEQHRGGDPGPPITAPQPYGTDELGPSAGVDKVRPQREEVRNNGGEGDRMSKVDSSTDGKRRRDDPSEVGTPTPRYPNDSIRWGRPNVHRSHVAALSGGGRDSGRVPTSSSSAAISDPERARGYGATIIAAVEADHAAIDQAALAVPAISSSMSAVIGREK
jgi:hypothetical protein